MKKLLSCKAKSTYANAFNEAFAFVFVHQARLTISSYKNQELYDFG